MPVSMYDLTVPALQRGLNSLKTYLDKIEAFAEEKGIDASELVAARLAPDMLPLAGQFQRASDTAKFAVSRLTGIDAPRFEDTETTLSELRERVAKTEEFLATVAPEAFVNAEQREVTIAPGGNKITMRGDQYLLSFALPNLYFHIATAHGILRHSGLPVGKRDYLGSFS